MRSFTISAVALVLGVGVALAPMKWWTAKAQEVVSASGAVFRGLDKVAGVSNDIELTAGQSASFGRLTVTLTECRHPADNPAADAFAHVTISDPNAQAQLFSGWMIASSPAVNALDHARYDIWLLRCTTS